MLALPVLLLLPASASNPPWGAKPYRYLIIDQDLRDVLVEFGRNLNVPTQVTPAIGGRRVKGPLHAAAGLTAREFLQRLCDGYSLVWYFDGTVLHISSAEEIGTDLVRIDRSWSSDILKKLGDLGLSDPRFTVRVADDGGVLSVSGPPAFRSLVRKAALTVSGGRKSRPAREAEMKDDVEVRVFRGGR